MVGEARPLIAYFSKRGKPKPRVERITADKRPPFNYSGAFGYWIAGLLRPDLIRLLGFDMESGFGHFYPEPVRHNHGRASYREGYYDRLRKELKDTLQAHQIDTMIFQRGAWKPLQEAL